MTAQMLAALALSLTLGVSEGEARQTGLQNGQASVTQFEVASIKPDTSDGRGMSLNIERSGRFRGSGVPLKLIMQEAYQVKDSQILGAPSWLGSDKFVIDTKPDEATAAEMQKLAPDLRKEKLMLMLRALLVERCKLVLRTETRDLPVYALLVGKTGIKFHESAPLPEDAAPPGPPGPNSKMARHGIRTGRGEMEASDIEMQTVADVLSNQLGRPVVDKTGLTGKYDFTMKWTPDEHEGQMFKGAGPGADAGASQPPPAEPAGPSIFTAVQEQLGLKLEAQKSPMAVLVIDRIEKPSAN